MEVDGDNHHDSGEEQRICCRPRRSMGMKEWTLEHHKHFVDTMVGLEKGDCSVRTPSSRRAILIVELMNSPVMTAVPRSTILHHMTGFSHLQKKTHDSLSSRHSRLIMIREFGSLNMDNSLMSDFERLNINSNIKKKDDVLSSWTLEHHQKLVEAVIRLGGLGKATPMGILRLMEEERRRGLTVGTLRMHLSGLRHLQRETQEMLNRYHKELYKFWESLLITELENLKKKN